MVPKKLWELVLVATFALSIQPNRLTAQQPQTLRHRKMRQLIANAKTPLDYRRLAMYFHYQEQVDRSKADAEMQYYSECFLQFRPKFPTAADNASRLYEYYSAKANEEAKLAAHYDDLLIRSGSKPVGKVQTVSVTDLESQSAQQGTNSVLVRDAQTAGQPK
jgi:hypothetical protein